MFAKIRVSCARSAGKEGGGILLKARVKADFLLSWGGSKLLSRKMPETCGAEGKTSLTLWKRESGEQLKFTRDTYIEREE